jgi:hypothetical protein
MISTAFLKAQNAGIGIASPVQKLDIDGGIRIGGTTAEYEGSIRWNEIKNDFEGFNGTSWISLTGGKGQWGHQASYATEDFASQFNLFYANTYGTMLGYSMAGLGDWIVAGAFRDASPYNEDAWHSGSMRMMRRTPGGWILEHSIYDPAVSNSNFFGFSVGLSPTHVISGAKNADLPGAADQGKAYIYAYDTTNYTLQSSLVASDGQAADWFGNAVGISGDFAVVGAPGNDILGINNMGRAYIFQRNGTTWSQSLILTPSDGTQDDQFGTTVAIWGDYLAIAAPYKTYNGVTLAGKVYVYRKNQVGWSLIAQLNSPSPVITERYGSALSIRDNVLVIGASHYTGGSNNGNGSVYVYSISNNTVSYQATLIASDGKFQDGFGSSVDFLDNVILVGAPYANIQGISKQGKAYIFEYVNGNWQEVAIVKATSLEPQINFGNSVALIPDFGVVGAPFADMPGRTDNGQLFFFKEY